MDLAFGTETPEIDVLIVGAGLSGLTSALKIMSKEKSLSIKIIDENDYSGGQLGEHGTRFVDTEQTNMINYMKIFRVTPLSRQPNLKLKRCWDLDCGPTSVLAKFELGRYIDMLELRMKQFYAANFRIRKRMISMDQHICRNLFFNKSRQFILNVVELVCGVEASQVNYDEFMCMCSSCGGLRTLLDLYFNFSNSVFEISSKQIIEELMDKLKLIEIIYGRRVLEVEHYKNYVNVTDTFGDKYIAHTVILAIPWNRVDKLRFKPQIPEPLRPSAGGADRAKRMITQFYMKYDKSVWESIGYSGNFLSSSPLMVGYSGRTGIYSGYILHSFEEQHNVPHIVLQLLVKKFGAGMSRPLEYKQNSYELSQAAHKPQVTPWHRVIWSSSAAGGTYYRNLMGGAVQSGVRAAVNALLVLRPQLVVSKDLYDLQEKKRYANVETGRFKSLLSRLNLYNVTFYSLFVLSLVLLLNHSFKSCSELDQM